MRTYLLLAFMLMAVCCQAQKISGLGELSSKPVMNPRDTIDRAVLCVHYKMWEVKDIRAEEKKYRTYDMFLQVGEKLSKFSDYNRYLNDSTMMMEVRQGADNMTIMTGAMSRMRGVPAYSEEIFKNYPEGSCTVYDKINVINDYYCEDSEATFEWTLLTEEQPDTILGYPCAKATTTFRGRTYEAWYTDVIALDNGPWKFQGLPGLILYVKDTEKNYIFECIGLYRPDWDSPIVWKKGAKKASRKKFVAAKKRSGEDPIGALMNSGVVKSIKAADGSPITSSASLNRPPYNPIELE